MNASNDEPQPNSNPTPALPQYNRSRSGTIRGPVGHSSVSFNRTRSGRILDSGAPPARTRSGTVLGPRPSVPPNRTRSGTILAPAAVSSKTGSSAAPSRTRSGTIVAPRSRVRSGSILVGPDLPVSGENPAENDNEEERQRNLSIPETDGNPIAEEPSLAENPDVEMEVDMGYADDSFSPPNSSSPDPIDFLSCRSGGAGTWAVAWDPPSPDVTRKKTVKMGVGKKQMSFGRGKLGAGRAGKGKRGRGRTRAVVFEDMVDDLDVLGVQVEENDDGDAEHVGTDPLNI